MHILIVNGGVIPVAKYGGTERVIWYLGKELVKMGHQITYLVHAGSYCDFAKVLILQEGKSYAEQIPENIDLVHFNFQPQEKINHPHVVTIHGNCNDQRLFDLNSIFVSQNHAQRFGSTSYVYNGLDWTDYGKVDLRAKRTHFHFLGNAAWRVKNVKGAIALIDRAENEKLAVIGGTRLNISMGFRFSTSLKTRFYGMLGGDKKLNLLRHSKGLIFPVRWHEPFGLALIESLYFGCPVFGTPYGSLPELINKDLGFLSNSAAALSEAMTQSTHFSPEFCHRYALENFNAKKMAEKYVEKYELVRSGKTLNATAPQLQKIQKEKFLDWIA